MVCKFGVFLSCAVVAFNCKLVLPNVVVGLVVDCILGLVVGLCRTGNKDTIEINKIDNINSLCLLHSGQTYFLTNLFFLL